MSKKLKSQDDFESELKSELPVFDGIAITSLKKADGTFLIVKIPVDVKNLVAGEVEVVDTATSRMEATEKFKIAVARNGII
jgi:hypothetical protein